MKKILLFVLLLFCIHVKAQFIDRSQYADEINDSKKTLKNNLYKSAAIIPVIDSIYIWAWNTNTLSLYLQGKHINLTYDNFQNKIYDIEIRDNHNGILNYYKLDSSVTNANGKIISNFKKRWLFTDWDLDSASYYSYDLNNNEHTKEVQQWSSGIMYSGKLYTSTYDANNNKLIYLQQNLSGTTWYDNNQHVYLYNANNDCTFDFTQTPDGSGGWKNSHKTVYIYDPNDNLTSIQNYNYSGTNLVNENISTYTYNASNLRTSFMYQIWDATTSSMINKTLTDYSYNGNNMISYTYKTWNATTSAWNIYYLYHATYDSHNNLKTSFVILGNGKRVNDFVAYYDPNDFQFAFSNTYYDLGASSLITYAADSTYTFYHTGTVGLNENINDKSVVLYPNPAKEESHFQYYNNKSGKVSLSIFNIAGKEIKQIYDGNLNEGTYTFDLKISDLSAGIYFLKLISDNKILTKKLQVLN